MNTVSVTASKRYDVLIGSGLLDGLGALTRQVSRAKTVCIVSDSNVWPLYGARAKHSLEQAGFSVVSYVFPAGEASKNGATYLALLNFLAENRLTRRDCLAALGGGVTGDLTGFAAATYLRGIDYVQLPTTLLAAVDSSVGGKTAIDLPAGKNLAGAFYQPNLVVCDTDTLDTLPKEIFRDGCAEVIKYGILYDPAMFAELARDTLDFDRARIITRCVQHKRDVVAVDEFDTKDRMRLNLGHTFGHGIEAGSGFAISHGSAVAAGIAIVSRAGVKYGICQASDCDRILSLLARFGLPTGTDIPAETICAAALSDKKRTGDSVNLIVPAALGNCVIRPTPVAELKKFLEAGL